MVRPEDEDVAKGGKCRLGVLDKDLYCYAQSAAQAAAPAAKRI